MEKIAAQDSFARGQFRGVARHLIPEGGCYDLLNFLLDDEDGSPYKRGGSAWLSGLPINDTFLFGAVAIWDGHTVAGDRTVIVGFPDPYVFAGPGHVYWPVAVSADDTVLLAGGANVNGFMAEASPPRLKFTEHDGVVVLSGDHHLDPRIVVYAGSRKEGFYSTGTVAMTKGSKTVTGSGTSWLANVDKGMILTVGVPSRWNVVQSVDSNTQITLRYPYGGVTESGRAYGLHPFAGINGEAGGVAACVEFVAGRLVGVAYGEPTKLRFSGFLSADSPFFGAPDYGVFASGDEHLFPGRILGINALRDTALVFTTAGLYAVRNMAYDLSDAAGNVQQTVEKIDGMVLWAQGAVATWGNALVVPARDGVYLVDGVSRPILLSRSIAELYRAFVQAGNWPGQGTVFRDTFLLPISTSAEPPVTQGWLACKLDGGRDGFWPWTRLSGGAVRVATVRQRGHAQPRLLGGGSGTGGRLAELKWFDPSAAYKNDADGTAFTYTLETRDYPTGSGQQNTVRKARVGYELVDAAADNPVLTFSFANEDGVFTAHADAAAEAASGSESWSFARRGRYARFRLSGSLAAASCVVRSVEAWARLAGRD